MKAKKHSLARKTAAILFVAALFLVFAGNIFAINRFPRPEFQSGHSLPEPTTPTPEHYIFEYGAIVVLAIAIALTSYFAIKKRSRIGIFWVAVFSVLFFGFWRNGCDCPVASVQNMTLSLFDSGYAIPLTLILFFTIPLVFTLFFGRTFCASVCPLGALQELVAIKPLTLPRWANQVLGIFPYIFLGLSVLAAATGSAFLVCQFHPFLGIFRFSASFGMIIFGAATLVVGVFIGRPYCRFLCPYGVLLNWVSRFAKWHISITPDECIRCGLCEDTCPYGAIETPTPGNINEQPQRAKRRLALLLALAPALIAGFGFVGSSMKDVLSLMHPDVRLAVQLEKENRDVTVEQTLESEAFWKTSESLEDFHKKVERIKAEYYLGGWVLGGFIGLVITLKLLALFVFRKRSDYLITKANCYSCGRCVEYCAKEQVRLKEIASGTKRRGKIKLLQRHL